MREQNFQREPLHPKPDRQTRGSDSLTQGSESPKSPKRSKKTSAAKKSPQSQQLYPVLDDLDDSTSTYDDVDHSIEENSEDVEDFYRKNRHKPPREDGNSPLRRTENFTDSGIGHWFLIAAVVCILAGFLWLYLEKKPSDTEVASSSDSIDYIKLFTPKLEAIKSKYGSQSHRFWKIVSSALKRQLNSEVAAFPAAIIVTVPREFSEVGSCIAKEISTEVNKIFNYSDDSYIDVRTLNSGLAVKTKRDLDEKLHAILSKGRAVVLDHIELLPGEAALLLHSYADGDNAPYKNAIIFLVFHVTNEHNELKDQLVEKSLTKLWEPVLGGDEMPALLSRIGNNIALLSPEKDLSCNY